MKAKHLIEKLQNLNPESEVATTDGHNWEEVRDIESIDVVRIRYKIYGHQKDEVVVPEFLKMMQEKTIKNFPYTDLEVVGDEKVILLI